jgi:ATP-dependent RNA helicase SUPV3L1/SUV3
VGVAEASDVAEMPAGVAEAPAAAEMPAAVADAPAAEVPAEVAAPVAEQSVPGPAEDSAVTVASVEADQGAAAAGQQAPHALPPLGAAEQASGDSALPEPASGAAEDDGGLAAGPQPAPVTEPDLVEVWRPGGRSEERRGPRRPQQWQRRQPQGEAQAKGPTTPAEDGATSEGTRAAAEADAPAETKGGQQRRPRGPQGDFRRDREDGAGRRPREHRAEHRSERSGDRPERRGGDRANLAKGRADHKDRRDFTPHREREKQADPTSPFAKLAALKAQLEAAAKERR